MTAGRAPFLLGVLLLLAAAAFSAARFRTTTDVTRLLALGGGSLELAKLSHQLAHSELSRTVILCVAGPAGPAGTEQALAGAAAVGSALRADPEIAWVREGLEEDAFQAYHRLYFPRRHLFLSPEPERELSARLSEAGLREAARALKHQLTLPTATLVKRFAPADPLLAFRAQLQRLERARSGALRLRAGRFLSEDDQAVLFLGTRGSAFDTGAQRRVVAAIDRAFARANAAAGGVLRLEWSGIGRIALASEQSIKADVTRVSALSTLGIVLLFLLLFRSPRLLLLGLLPLGAGVVLATALSLALFGELHGLTLAFGSALIGICIDYPVHLFNHHTLEPHPAGPRGTLARVWLGLLLGALTTGAGFAGLLWGSLPGIREIAVFGTIGILGALFATRVLVTPLLPATPPARPLQRRLATGLAGLVAAMQRRRLRVAVLPLGALLLCGLGLPRIPWVDDLRVLYAVDPELQANQLRVRARVSRVDGARFVIALAPDLETALQRNDAAALRLQEAERAGLLAGTRSLHAFLWSARLQARNQAVLDAQPGLAARTAAALAAEGFRPEAFAPFAAHLAAPPPAPLSFDELMASPLGEALRSFVVRLDDQVAVLSFLRGVEDSAALGATLADLEGVHYLDQNHLLAQTHRHYRQQVLELILLGLLAVLALVALRYRRVRATLAAFLPALLAAATTLALLALAGEPVHILHLVALLLVLSIGVDYGIFLAEARRHPGGIGATLLSIATACCTTILAFGLLALSAAPAPRAIGLTTGIGVLTSLVLAPTVLVLAGGEESS